MFTRTLLIGNFYLLLLSLTAALFSCNKSDVAKVVVVKADSSKTIISFSIKKGDGTTFAPADISIAIYTDTIKIVLPPGTNITNLIPAISFQGVSISPKSGENQNFLNPVIYTVTAADGSTRKYVVLVSILQTKGTVFFGSSDNNFYAVDAATGSLKWKYSGTQSFAYSSPTYKDGVIYVGSIDSYVYAFNATNGSIIWQFKAGNTGIESDAVIVDSTVYVGSNDYNLYALNAYDGSVKWKFLTGRNVSSSPVINNGIVYFGSSDNNLYALQASNGKLIWQFPTGAMINQSGACLSNGILYVGSRDAYLYAVDAATGKLVWRYNTNGISMESSSPTVNNGIVYFASWYNVPSFNLKGSAYAVNALNGQLIWQTLNNTGFSSSPFVKNNRFFITGDDGYIDALNVLDGSLIWRKLVYANSASPVEVNGVVYIGGGGTRFFYALDAATGKEIWKIPTTGLMTSSALVVDDLGIPNYGSDSGALQ